MNRMPSREQVEYIRERYPAGTRVVLHPMGDPQAPPPGTGGTVVYVDDAGQIGVHWDSGSSLALIPGVDSFSGESAQEKINSDARRAPSGEGGCGLNLGNDPADQIVRFTLEGTEVALKLSGLAAKNFAMFAYAVLKDQKKTRGKTRLVRMLKEQRPFKFFQIPVQFRKEFAKEARRHGLLYVPIRNKRNRSELELVVFADDAAKVNRILDNLNLDFVRSQAGEAAVEHPEETGGRGQELAPPAPIRTETVSIGNEKVEFELGGFDEVFSLSPAAREADTENFTQGRERNGNPSEPFSRGRGSSPDWEGDDRTPGRKESVKKLLREIRQEQAQRRTKREERRGPEHTAPARSRKRKKKRQKGR